jgi:hypothetical protein
MAGGAPKLAILAAIAERELLHMGDNAEVLTGTIVDEDLPRDPGLTHEVTAFAAFIAVGLVDVATAGFGQMLRGIAMALAAGNGLGVGRVTVGMAIETFLGHAAVEVDTLEVLVTRSDIPPAAGVKRQRRLKEPFAHPDEEAGGMGAGADAVLDPMFGDEAAAFKAVKAALNRSPRAGGTVKEGGGRGFAGSPNGASHGGLLVGSNNGCVAGLTLL